ncbi:hypothetical protein, partial [Aeromonas sp. QDB30]|uniref:hypothetical protein n=1 Tax=Aeromonas sp. QDB30 TaxID=2989831 RepID=UPI0022E6DA14
GVFGDSQFTSTLSVNFHFPKIPRRTRNMPPGSKRHRPVYKLQRVIDNYIFFQADHLIKVT